MLMYASVRWEGKKDKLRFLLSDPNDKRCSEVG